MCVASTVLPTESATASSPFGLIGQSFTGIVRGSRSARRAWPLSCSDKSIATSPGSASRLTPSQAGSTASSSTPITASVNRRRRRRRVDHFELDKGSLNIVERTIGHKERMIVATPDGVEERAVTRDLADRPSLSDEQVHAVAQLLKKVDGHYGWPQDIEWGWKRDRLYQFQSRPVTTIQPRWTRDDPAERFPNPITPLSSDFILGAFRSS